MAVSDRCCRNAECPQRGKFGRGDIIKHCFFKLSNGSRRRRYRCKVCGGSFVSTRDTPYYRLRCSQSDFDEVAAMSVEGVSISAIARVKGLSWNTVARWLERAAVAAGKFNDRMTRGYEMKEVQADEIRTFLTNKDTVTWVMATIEVWSRLWPSTIVGRRSYRNLRSLIEDTTRRGRIDFIPLITTDGYYYYGAVLRHMFKGACVHGQVVKTRRKDRVVRVDRKLVIGSRWQLEDALWRSEDSEKLNTSFIERMNLTIRQGSAYLNRRSPCHARCAEHLEDHLELLRCHYNFIRPHRGLKFGKEVRTPAMQAGLASRRLSFREIFTAVAGPLFRVCRILDFKVSQDTMAPLWKAA